ncbi:MAG: hypothetical protein M3O25_10400 [Actinomycetota bacterium]|nr:hypothetical protein [Actinomycetota bacterium]
MSWRVTVRHGSKVTKESFESLDDALVAARDAADRSRRSDRLPAINALRDFTPDKRVQCRVEVSGKGFLRGPEAGIDVMGDGSLVPYAGAIRKRQLQADSLDEAIGLLHEALRGGSAG